MKFILKFVLFAFLITPLNETIGQTDTIRVPSTNVLNTKKLKLGKRHYITYVYNPHKPESLFFSLWTRNTKIEERNGEKVLVTEEVWRGADSTLYNEIHSVNRLKDFAPIHTKTKTIQGTMAYDWSEKGVTRSQKVPNNIVKPDFSVSFKVPVLNWHMDMETFQMLPLGPDKTFAIHFYDAGSRPPKSVVYRVIGEEVITGYNGAKIDCWKLHTSETNRGTTISQTFWISKKNNELIKEEDDYGGIIRHKIKLPVATQLPTAPFNQTSK